jgi:NitT/TauT family transport system substrate-binding protein
MRQTTSRPRSGKISISKIAVLLVAAALLAGGYAWISRTSPSRPAGPLEQVTIANIRYPGTCPVIVAQAKGYFAAEGILATISNHTTGQATLDAVFRGQANLGSTGDLPVMFAVMNRQPASIVATIATAENDLGIVGRKDRGVVTPASLKGKRIGVPLVSGGHFLLDAFLTRQKLSTSDITVRNLKPEELSAALAKGDIDAASTWQPYLGTLQTQLGENGATFLSGGIYDAAVGLIGSKDYVANHPETIKSVLRALVSAARFCRNSPDAALEFVAEAMKPDIVNLKELWPLYRFNVALDQSLVLALEDETRWALKNKLTDRTDMPNYLNHVYLDALQSITPSAVTIIH